MTPMVEPIDTPALLGGPRTGQSPILDRAQPVSPIEPIAGRVLFAGGQEMSCTVRMRSPTRGEVQARLTARFAIGEVVICALDDVGILLGTIEARLSGGFGVVFACKDERRSKVAAQLEWHAANAERTALLRRAPRIVPLHREVEVRLAEKVVLDGTILNISMSGAAIALRPDPGLFVRALVRVGDHLATVIRSIEGGIAVQFADPFMPHTFDERIRL